MNEIVLTSIKINELEILIENSVSKALIQCGVAHKTEPIETEPDILDIRQASKFLNLAVPTIYGLVSRRALISYKQSKKLYFKRSELLQWIQSGKRSSLAEIQANAKNFNRLRK